MDDKAPLISKPNSSSNEGIGDKGERSPGYGAVPETTNSIATPSDAPPDLKSRNSPNQNSPNTEVPKVNDPGSSTPFKKNRGPNTEKGFLDPDSGVQAAANQAETPPLNIADEKNLPAKRVHSRVAEPHTEDPPEQPSNSNATSSDGESSDQSTSLLGRLITKLPLPKSQARRPVESQEDVPEEKNKPKEETDPLVEDQMESDSYNIGNKGSVSYGDSKNHEDEKNDDVNFFVYYLAFFATIGGLLFGYDTGIVSGAMLLIEDYFDLSTIWKEIIVSGTVAAAAVFSLFAGFTCDYFGRKITIMMASVVFAAGAVVMGVSDSKEVLLAGRIVVGMGIGFASMTVPVYVAEASPPAIRGRLVTLNQLLITVGILISSIIAGAFSSMKQTGWRYMLGLAAVPGVIQFLGFFYLPESPRWLVTKGKTEKAVAVLQRIRGKSDVHKEIQEIKASVEEDRKVKGFVLGKIMSTPHVRRALFVGCGLQVFQQLCGINTVIYYSATILRMAGFPSSAAIWLVMVPNSINFLATFIGLWLVERTGRRRLLAGSFVGVVIALVVLAVGFQLSANFSPNIDRNVTETFNNGSLLVDKCYNRDYSSCESCIENKDCGFCFRGDDSEGSCLMADEDSDDEDAQSEYGRCNETNLDLLGTHWAYGYCPTDYNWMAVLGLALFVLGFAPGLGPMPWTINAEIYPLWARSTCNSMATGCNWICNLFVALFFLTLTETITKYGAFWLFGCICFMGLLFTLIFVPETKNKSLEEVEELFMRTPKGIDNIGYLKDSVPPKNEINAL